MLGNGVFAVNFNPYPSYRNIILTFLTGGEGLVSLSRRVPGTCNPLYVRSEAARGRSAARSGMHFQRHIMPLHQDHCVLQSRKQVAHYLCWPQFNRLYLPVFLLGGLQQQTELVLLGPSSHQRSTETEFLGSQGMLVCPFKPVLRSYPPRIPMPLWLCTISVRLLATRNPFRSPCQSVVFKYRLLTVPIIWLRVLKVSDTHHLNTVSSSIRFATAYSTSSIGYEAFAIRFAKAYSISSIGYEAFTYFKAIQLDNPSLHWQSSFHPFVVVFGIQIRFLVSIDLLATSIAVLSLTWFVILCKTTWRSSSSSHWAKTFFAIKFAWYPYI